MKAITLNQLSVAFDGVTIVQSQTFELATGQWLGILGRSGCGKSTLLKLMAGLPTSASLTGSLDVHIPDFAYMAQQDGLFAWLNVLDNVLLSIGLHRRPQAHEVNEAHVLLKAVGLAGVEHRRIQELSGGQRQRVALARTLMTKAELILMDEPFSAVDAMTRLELQKLAHRLLAHKTVVLITHDPWEAMRLCDRVVVMKEGALLEPVALMEAAPRFTVTAQQPSIINQWEQAL